MPLVIRRGRPEDHERAFRLATQSFPMMQVDQQTFKERFQPEKMAMAELDGVILAQAIGHPMGHWFGGRIVDSVGIAGVAVSQEARGKGIGTALVRWLLDDGVANGRPISALYPATIPIYRSLGYGDAFHRTTYGADLDAVPRLGAEGVVIREMQDSDKPELFDAFDRHASNLGGVNPRTRDWWENRILTKDAPQRFLAFEDGQLTGWLIYGFSKAPNDWRYDIVAHDFVWTTSNTALALMQMVSMARSTCRELRWNGPPDEPLLQLMHDHAIELKSTLRAMLRLVDVPQALLARGYSPAIDAAITLAVSDSRRPANEGPWRITVQKGVASVEYATSPVEATVSVQALASMYSGFTQARDATRIGSLQASPSACSALEAIFSGPRPWLPDFF